MEWGRPDTAPQDLLRSLLGVSTEGKYLSCSLGGVWGATWGLPAQDPLALYGADQGCVQCRS